MDYPICINQNSFPASSKEIGEHLFNNSLQGVLELFEEEDRCLFYLDSDTGNLFDFEIAKSFTYQDFLDNCIDQDLSAFLYEIEDKCPALDELSEEQIEEMASYTFYVKDRAMDNFVDVYALTWMLSGFLLSINTEEVWGQSLIQMQRVDADGRLINENTNLRNISSQEHGAEHLHELSSVDIEELVAPNKISETLLAWFKSQSLENQSRVVDKLRLSCQRDFIGGKPLFETLENADGLREVRFSAHSGGTIRILFKPFGAGQALLVGFIKKSDNEGYDAAIKKAKEIYPEMAE